MYSRISDIPSILNIYLWNEQMNILQGKKKPEQKKSTRYNGTGKLFLWGKIFHSFGFSQVKQSFLGCTYFKIILFLF